MCLSPVTITNSRGVPQKVACGHCLQCLSLQQSQWAARISEEMSSWRGMSELSGFPPVVFWTLTYDDAHVPHNYLVVEPNGVHLYSDDQVPEGWFDSLPDPIPALPRKFRLHFDSKDLASKKDVEERAFARYKDCLKCVYDQMSELDDDAIAFDHLQYHFDHPLDAALEYVGFYNHIDPSLSVEHTCANPYFIFDGIQERTPLDDRYQNSRPLLVIEFNSCRFHDVTNWIKRCRINLVRNVPSVFDAGQNLSLIHI